jgi:hypothetical protein
LTIEKEKLFYKKLKLKILDIELAGYGQSNMIGLNFEQLEILLLISIHIIILSL